MTESIAPLFCENHPSRETVLRCNRCEKPICVACAVHTPTGYRCKECIRGQQKIFENADWYDFFIGFAAAGFLSFIASLVVSFVSGFFFGLFVLVIAPTAGVVIARGVQLVVQRKRSRNLFRVIAAGVVVGGLPMLFYLGAPLLFSLSVGSLGGFGVLLPLIWQVVYIFMVTPAVYYQLSGIQIK